MPYHGIIVAVDHDGPAASKVNILLPPVAHLCKTNKGSRKRKEWHFQRHRGTKALGKIHSPKLWCKRRHYRNLHSWRPTRTSVWGTTAVWVPGSFQSLLSSLPSVHTARHPSVGALTPDTVNTEKCLSTKCDTEDQWFWTKGEQEGQKNKLTMAALPWETQSGDKRGPEEMSINRYLFCFLFAQLIQLGRV